MQVKGPKDTETRCCSMQIADRAQPITIHWTKKRGREVGHTEATSAFMVRSSEKSSRTAKLAKLAWRNKLNDEASLLNEPIEAEASTSEGAMGSQRWVGPFCSLGVERARLICFLRDSCVAHVRNLRHQWLVTKKAGSCPCGSPGEERKPSWRQSTL